VSCSKPPGSARPCPEHSRLSDDTRSGPSSAVPEPVQGDCLNFCHVSLSLGCTPSQATIGRTNRQSGVSFMCTWRWFRLGTQQWLEGSCAPGSSGKEPGLVWGSGRVCAARGVWLRGRQGSRGDGGQSWAPSSISTNGRNWCPGAGGWMLRAVVSSPLCGLSPVWAAGWWPAQAECPPLPLRALPGSRCTRPRQQRARSPCLLHPPVHVYPVGGLLLCRVTAGPCRFEQLHLIGASSKSGGPLPSPGHDPRRQRVS